MDLHSHTESYFFLPLGDLKKTCSVLLVEFCWNYHFNECRLELEGQGPIKKILCIHNFTQTTFPASLLLPKDSSHRIWAVSSYHSHPLPSLRRVLHDLTLGHLTQLSPAPPYIHHSCHSGPLPPHGCVKHSPSSRTWHSPFFCPWSFSCRARGPASLPSDLRSDVPSWERSCSHTI